MATKGQLTLGKWHFKFGIILVYWSKRYLFHFGLFKMISWPPEGVDISKENYKGFWFRKEFLPKGFEISI